MARKAYPHNRRVPIFGLVVCFIYAYCAEKVFGIADITGAYVAGIMLSNLKETNYIDRKVDINSYMLFAPVFFANIGINANFSGFNATVFLFGLAFVAVGIAGKIIGCGGVGRMIATEALRHGADLTIGIIPQDKELVEEFIREAKQTMPDAKVQYAVTADIHDKFDVIINASPVGMFPKVDACPVSDELIDGADYFFDVIYNPTKTLFLRKALEKGKVAKGGAAMLVLQAVRGARDLER